MDKDNISRIINEELAAAKEWAAKQQKGYRRHDLIAYVLAVIVAVGSYFLLQKYQPSMVLKTDASGLATFDRTRAVVLSIIFGLAILLAHAVMF